MYLRFYNRGTHHHAKPCGEHPRVSHHTVSRLEHALDLATVGTRGQSLHCLAEVAECTVLLFPVNKDMS